MTTMVLLLDYFIIEQNENSFVRLVITRRMRREPVRRLLSVVATVQYV